MKKTIKRFIHRGLLASSGGPVVLAIIYGILGTTGEVTSLTPSEVSIAMLTVTLMAFIAAGVGVVYELEQLPLLGATLIHAFALYADYLLVYWLNNWIPRSASGIGIFTLVYFSGYFLIWLCVTASIKANTAKINKQLHFEN